MVGETPGEEIKEHAKIQEMPIQEKVSGDCFEKLEVFSDKCRWKYFEEN